MLPGEWASAKAESVEARPESRRWSQGLGRQPEPCNSVYVYVRFSIVLDPFGGLGPGPGGSLNGVQVWSGNTLGLIGISTLTGSRCSWLGTITSMHRVIDNLGMLLNCFAP